MIRGGTAVAVGVIAPGRAAVALPTLGRLQTTGALSRQRGQARIVNQPRQASDISAVTAQTQVERAYAALEARIVTLQLEPGQLVSEHMLASLVGLGRTPVRDAIKELSREGLMVILPKRGIMISEIDVLRQLELLEIRREVERYVVGAAARRATPGERARFLALAELMRETGAADDGEGFLKLDKEFNERILEAAKNRYAASMMRLVQGLSRRFFFAHFQSTTSIPETARLHAAVARAIGSQREAEARDCLDRLMDNVETFTRATLDCV